MAVVRSWCEGAGGPASDFKILFGRFVPVCCGAKAGFCGKYPSGSAAGPGAFGGELDCVLSSEDGGQSGGESQLGMAKEMDSILHCRFTTLNPSW